MKESRRAASRTLAEVSQAQQSVVSVGCGLFKLILLPILVSVYVTKPADNSSTRADKALLLLPDIYGLAIPYALR